MLTVKDEIAFKLPEVEQAVLQDTTTKSFTLSEPSTLLAWLGSCKVPSIPFIEMHECALGQAWFDSARGFMDRHFQGQSQTQVLPFWVLTWWKAVHASRRALQLWLSAAEWLVQAQKAGDPELSMNAQHIIESFNWLHWNIPVTVFGTFVDTYELAQLPANAWLSDGVIDAMMMFLQNGIEEKQPAAGTLGVTTLAFHVKVLEMERTKTYNLKCSKIKQTYGGSRCGPSQLLFPINVNGNHWVAG
ncbi:hypothetical protein K439DRAFT_1613109 [Ramaria rubella]|nr:hypothetical protein K439DRAFT_1613109 [Ramaria rubella]